MADSHMSASGNVTESSPPPLGQDAVEVLVKIQERWETCQASERKQRRLHQEKQIEGQSTARKARCRAEEGSDLEALYKADVTSGMGLEIRGGLDIVASRIFRGKPARATT